MRVAICQVNPTVGAFARNVETILAAAREAAAHGAELAVFPELAVCGYPPMDLVHKSSFLEATGRALADLAAGAPAGLGLLVGAIAANPHAASRGGKALSNAAALVERGAAPRIVARKCLLPTYDVFDEARYFEPWDAPRENVLAWRGRRIGLTICEDIWNDKSFWPVRLYPTDPVEEVVAAGAELIVNLSASPWQKEKERLRDRMLRACAERHGRPVIYVNQVGGNDGLIFDGGSMCVAPTHDGKSAICNLQSDIPQFEEGVLTVDPFDGEFQIADCRLQMERESRTLENVERALTLGVRDYCAKMGFRGAVLGLSGGIDSSVTAAIAVDALGPENVVGISMPSQYSSGHSMSDADLLARNLGIRCERLPIGPLFDLYRETLRPVNGGLPEDVTEENLQARIRGALLMAFSNKHGHLLLTTGNKSECAVGFCTLYGDTCGGLAVIADLWKTEVYALARHLNRERERIPAAVLSKPASPELKPDQRSQDYLPPFDVLDPVLQALVEDELSPEEAAARTGAKLALVRGIQQRVYYAEYKRFQFAPALRVSKRAWVGRVYPIVHRFTE
ncbi:MAG TPA: NAD+ synthase [Planctomycetota bacterium]|nr:NAD+ synthase [Planctomycetota bacterium]